MSACTQLSMTNHHDNGLWGHLTRTIVVWMERLRQRNELAQWTDRDLRDVGLNWSDVTHEAEKPFWRS